MSESTLIKGDSNCNLFVDAWEDGGVWLSIQTPHGGAHCVISEDQIPAMIEALQAAIGEQA